MKEFFGFIAGVTCVLLVIAAISFGLDYANQKWNCNSYSEAPVKFMAGTCYAQQKNGKWVTLDSYVKATNVEFSENK